MVASPHQKSCRRQRRQVRRATFIGRPRVLAIVLCIALGCDRALVSGGDAADQRATSREVATIFDGERAFADLRDLVAIGPRPASSPGAAAARTLISERLRQAGWTVEEQPFEATDPGARRHAMVNLIATRGGPSPAEDGLILFVTHYDTKRLAGTRFVGANDGASGVALLLEVARQLGPPLQAPLREPRHQVWIAFCDGEEAFGRDITPTDGLYGSRALAERMERDGSLARIRALILVDMVADADLNLADNLASPARLRRWLSQAAEELGDADVIDRTGLPGLIDDHSPFVERGVSNVLTLIDFQYGGRWTPGSSWHTERDDLAAVSARSLNRVGALTVQVFKRIDRSLGAQ